MDFDFLSQSDHGGGCCGISHVSGFRSTFSTTKEGQHLLEEDVDLLLKCLEDSELFDKLFDSAHYHLIEIVLTDEQIEDRKELVKKLKKAGFKLVSRFLNGNSGNFCNVLHWRQNRLEGSPFNKL